MRRLIDLARSGMRQRSETMKAGPGPRDAMGSFKMTALDEIKPMTFEAAVTAGKQGVRIARRAWQGKLAVEFVAAVEGRSGPCFALVRESGMRLLGWCPSQDDMLTDDWGAVADG